MLALQADVWIFNGLSLEALGADSRIFTEKFLDHVLF